MERNEFLKLYERVTNHHANISDMLLAIETYCEICGKDKKDILRFISQIENTIYTTHNIYVAQDLYTHSMRMLSIYFNVVRVIDIKTNNVLLIF